MQPDPFIAQDLHALSEVESVQELRQVLPRLTFRLPITGTCPEVPYFPIAPPTYAPPDEWPSLLSNFSFPQGAVERLLAGGRFMPLDLEMFNEQTSGQSCYEPLTSEPHVLLDAEYGVAPYKEDSPVWANVPFTQLAVERLQRHYPEVTAKSHSVSFAWRRADGALHVRNQWPYIARYGDDGERQQSAGNRQLHQLSAKAGRSQRDLSTVVSRSG